MKCVHLSTTSGGGAGRAASRLVKALRVEGVDATLVTSADAARPVGQVVQVFRSASGILARGIMGEGFRSHPAIGLQSPALLPSNWPKWVNDSSSDLVHLHWINDEMLSISDIGKMRKPLVWTMHDMWPIGGAAHFFGNDDGQVWKPHNRFDRWVWERKKRHWQNPMHLVAPSEWLAGLARSGSLTKHQPITVIPNPIDTEVWQAIERNKALETLGLSQSQRYIVFGASGSVFDQRKGFDLMDQALRQLQFESLLHDVVVVVLGGSESNGLPQTDLPVHFAGKIQNDELLNLYYSACDVAVIPSRLDNLPNVAIEALACGTPVVAFDVGGLRDVVDHQHTGYLARSESVEDLAKGISWVLGLRGEERIKMGLQGREYVAKYCNPQRVAKAYTDVYCNALERASR